MGATLRQNREDPSNPQLEKLPQTNCDANHRGQICPEPPDVPTDGHKPCINGGMHGPDAAFWQDRFERGDTPWDRGGPSPQLMAWLPRHRHRSGAGGLRPGTEPD